MNHLEPDVEIGYPAEMRRLSRRMGTESAYDPRRFWAASAVSDVEDGPGAEWRRELYSDKQLIVLRTTIPPGIRFAGEIDASNSRSVGMSIAAATGLDRDVHVDVSSLLFCDISGIRELVSAAEAMNTGRRLLIHGMPSLLETVIRVVGWNQLPTLVVCECGID